MRTLFLLLPLLGLSLFSAAQSKGDRQVLDTELRRFEAMTRRDTVRLPGFLADDLVYVHSNAMRESKKEHIAAIAAGRLVYQKMTREQVAVRRYGKTALTNGVAKVQGILNNNTFELRLSYTAVYRKKGGTWRLASWQSTRIP